MGYQILKKTKGEYEKMLAKGENGEWMHDIDKDLGRTYPSHPFFDVSKGGTVG